MDGGAWKAAVHGVAECRTWLSDFTFTFHFHALEKEMATHSSVLAWRIPGMGKPGGLPSMGSHRIGHDWSDLAIAIAIGNASHGTRSFGFPPGPPQTSAVFSSLSLTWHIQMTSPVGSQISHGSFELGGNLWEYSRRWSQYLFLACVSSSR